MEALCTIPEFFKASGFSPVTSLGWDHFSRALHCESRAWRKDTRLKMQSPTQKKLTMLRIWLQKKTKLHETTANGQSMESSCFLPPSIYPHDFWHQPLISMWEGYKVLLPGVESITYNTPKSPHFLPALCPLLVPALLSGPASPGCLHTAAKTL